LAQDDTSKNFGSFSQSFFTASSSVTGTEKHKTPFLELFRQKQRHNYFFALFP